MNYYKLEVKKQSPNCLEFYLNKGLEPLEAEQKLKEFRSKLPKENILPSQIGYWTNKGYSEKDAKLKVSEFQKRDLNSQISLYGIDEGTKR